ncbi:MAG: hypothetical protein COT85_04860 [Chlamydiae bacterium CG10_big_fil_rev_8_21_14_0_10_42_34]|nr:MAG: hypothetical protein COT85_04860 [Chlamydiae bacterium CG10_big_fil_rev_8_21_14_0_10_42_34]
MSTTELNLVWTRTGLTPAAVPPKHEEKKSKIPKLKVVKKVIKAQEAASAFSQSKPGQRSTVLKEMGLKIKKKKVPKTPDSAPPPAAKKKKKPSKFKTAAKTVVAAQKFIKPADTNKVVIPKRVKAATPLTPPLQQRSHIEDVFQKNMSNPTYFDDSTTESKTRSPLTHRIARLPPPQLTIFEEPKVEIMKPGPSATFLESQRKKKEYEDKLEQIRSGRSQSAASSPLVKSPHNSPIIKARANEMLESSISELEGTFQKDVLRQMRELLQGNEGSTSPTSIQDLEEDLLSNTEALSLKDSGTDEDTYLDLGWLNKNHPSSSSIESLDTDNDELISATTLLHTKEEILKLPFSSSIVTLNLDESTVTDDQLIAFLTVLPKLKTISLSECKNLTATGLFSLINVKTLESISISSCSQFTKDEVHRLLQDANWPELKSADFSSTAFSDHSIQLIPKFESLKTVRLNFCQMLTQNGLAHLKKMTNLKLEFLGAGLILEEDEKEDMDIVLEINPIQELWSTIALEKEKKESGSPYAEFAKRALEVTDAIAERMKHERLNPEVISCIRKIFNSSLTLKINGEIKTLDHSFDPKVLITKIPTIFDFLKKVQGIEIKTLELTFSPSHNVNSDESDQDVTQSFITLCTNLKYATSISFVNLSLEILPSTFLQAEFPYLEELDLSGNALSELPDGAFCKASKLRKFNCSNNRLINISADIFEFWPNIKIIDISSNEIPNLDDLFNTPLPHLTSFLAGGNKLKRLPQNLLAQAENLEVLDLSENEISSLDSLADEPRPNLKQLIVRKNKLKILPANLFNHAKNLVVIDLSENEISSLHNVFINHLPHLRGFLAGKNKLTSLPPFLLAYASELEVLDLSENQITDLGQLSKGPKATKILLQKNYIKELPADFLSLFPALKWLDLTENNLTKFHSGFFQKKGELETCLLLTKNELFEDSISEDDWQTLHDPSRWQIVDMTGMRGLTNISIPEGSKVLIGIYHS